MLIPLFMMWIYLTWSAILLGLQVAYVHQFFPLLRRRFYFTRRGAAVVSDVRWVLALGVLLHQRFQLGKGLHPYEAAELLMVPNEAAGQLLEGLETAGIVHTTKNETYAAGEVVGEHYGVRFVDGGAGVVPGAAGDCAGEATGGELSGVAGVDGVGGVGAAVGDGADVGAVGGGGGGK